MTIRDLQFAFDLAGAATSLVNNSGSAYLFPNSIDTSPLAAYLTEQTASDTTLTATSANLYRELGGGSRLWIVVDIITSVAATGGACTVDFALVTDDSSALDDVATLYDFGAIAKGSLTAGTRLIGALPRTTNYQQYLGMQYTIATNNVTTGTALAWIGWDVDEFVAAQQQASGFSIK